MDNFKNNFKENFQGNFLDIFKDIFKNKFKHNFNDIRKCCGPTAQKLPKQIPIQNIFINGSRTI